MRSSITNISDALKPRALLHERSLTDNASVTKLDLSMLPYQTPEKQMNVLKKNTRQAGTVPSRRSISQRGDKTQKGMSWEIKL